MSTLSFKTPLQFAASYTADFITSSIPDMSGAVLDIGCGDGLITTQLQKRGYTVVAIDASLKGIERAKTHGLNALHCKLEDFEHSPFDNIYMSRALHHMPTLKQTLTKVDDLLNEKGTFTVEDFAFEVADEAACDWLFKQSSEALATLSQPIDDCAFHHQWLHKTIAAKGEAYERWKNRYTVDHQLWSSAQMVSALKEYFRVQILSPVPYLFRFICDLLPATEEGARRAREVFADEQRLIYAGSIAAVGVRWVMSKR